MNGDERKRRAVAAQGFAALALFLFAHSAHAATLPAHAQQVGQPGVVSAQPRP
jgi:hypothetical protein